MTRSPFDRLARAVRERRRLLGIGLPELALDMGVSEALLAALERGEYDPRSLHVLAQRALSHRLDLTLDVFLL
ncbi:XRE family transcriptional regulator [Deinococcus sp. KNUC1210]|uniref:XRE family transcriptional regulator n=1 Tax=Deinococcus sp. KNUC1210 TaxID=2917691 RepID=UPI001EF0AEAF|nr:XRE family transcriptional regulator [Deinococcus sp. KNUC1210]ULH16685.1 XRE family transcriptional regulator [Deinococcus sp. KNUC1210]